MVTGVASDLIQAGVQEVLFAALLVIIVYWGLNRRWLKNVWARMFISLDVCLIVIDLPNCLHLWTGLNITNTFFAWYDVISVQWTVLTLLWRAGRIVQIQLTRAQRETEWEQEDGEISRRNVEGTSPEHGDGRHDLSPPVRDAHPGGD